MMNKPNMKQQNFNPKISDSIKKRGLVRFLFAGIKFFYEYVYYKILKKRKFIFDGKEYSYFYSPYNATWRNEREVEIPIIWKEVEKNNPKDVLEIGNVLGHYFKIKHEVIDKYEKVKGVKNIDIIQLKPNKRFDLIVAISTFEHIGFDESQKNPEKIIEVIKKLKSMISKNGKIIFTIPLGYNPHLDELIFKKSIKLNKEMYMKRISKDNRWIQINKESIKNMKFDFPYPLANALLVGVIKK